MSNLHKKGITVIELLVVIAAFGVLIAVVLPQFSKIKENQVLKNGVEDITSSINKSRSQTLASLNSIEYGVRFESDKIIIFTGKTFNQGVGSNEIINMITPASITSVALDGESGTSGDLFFNRLSGSPSKTGTIIISTPNYSKTITISATGAVSVN